MELKAKTIREVTFGAKVRGYDPAEVDEFIAAVADGFEELEERLKRAIERATRAEQQVASSAGASGAGAEPVVQAAQAAPVEAPVAAATPSNNEISKIWERAVAAAEEAVAEAKQTAQQLLAEAKAEAETKVGKAREEALRLAEEAQGQLRAEIKQLEQARDQLKVDVDRLGIHLAEEREKVRAVLVKALATVEDQSSGSAPAPQVTTVTIPQTPLATINERPTEESGSGSSNPFSAPVVEETSPSWTGQQQSGDGQLAAEPQGQQAFGAQSQQDETLPEAQLVDTQNVTQNIEEPQDPDQDPFLAELRKAVQDDGPLGPRDEDEASSGSIDSLYADGDEDKNNFFRRKK